MERYDKRQIDSSLHRKNKFFPTAQEDGEKREEEAGI